MVVPSGKELSVPDFQEGLGIEVFSIFSKLKYCIVSLATFVYSGCVLHVLHCIS